MGERTKEDIRKAKAEKGRILRHEESFEVCDSNKCVELKRKIRKAEGEDRIDAD